MLTALIVILLSITMLALAVIGSEPPQRIQTFRRSPEEHESEHKQTPPGVTGIGSVTVARFLGVIVLVNLLM